MTQEDKELLLKDLCARLPYGVKIEGLIHPEIMTIKHLAIISAMSAEPYKPYLRPMSSMTIEERQDWIKYCKADYDCEFQPEPTFDFESCILSINWLNKNHFDYCGLIPKGLAIEVTEENNPYKD